MNTTDVSGPKKGEGQSEYQQSREDCFATSIGSEISVAVDATTLEEVRELRKAEFRYVYPTMDLDNDVLDQQAIILYSRDVTGEINSTARLSVAGKYPLPEEQYLDCYRDTGQRIMEWGRFIIRDGDLALLKNYYRTIYRVASQLGFDVVVMAMQPGHISMHQSLMGLRIIEQHTGVNYGGEHNLACVAWELNTTKPKFFKWIAQ